MYNDEEWQSIQQFSAERQKPKYTTADKITALFCGAVMLYLICQVARVAL